jgi:hypothetical protein
MRFLASRFHRSQLTESGEVRGAPTLFIDGVVHLCGYDAETLLGLLKQ